MKLELTDEQAEVLYTLVNYNFEDNLKKKFRRDMMHNQDISAADIEDLSYAIWRSMARDQGIDPLI